MTSPLYGDILERSKRRQRGEDVETPNRYEEIAKRSGDRAIARGRSLPPIPTDPNPPTSQPTPSSSQTRSTPEEPPRRQTGGGSSWDDGEGFLTNFRRSFYDAAGPALAQSAGSAMQTLGDVLPDPAIAGLAPGSPLAAARSLRTGGKALQEFGGKHRVEPARVSSIGEALESWGNARDYVGSTLGQGLGSSVATLAATAVGGLPAGAAVAYGQQVGEVGQEVDQLAPTLPRGRRAAGVLGLAAPLAALDMFTEASAALGLKRAMAGGVTDLLAERTFKEAAKNIGGAMVKGAASEGLTEGLQEGGQYIGTRRLTGTPMSLAEGLERAGEATIAGALPGSVMGGAGQAAQEMVGYQQRKGIGEGSFEFTSSITPKSLPRTGVDPDYEVFDDFETTPVEPVAPAPPSAANPPRPGNVPQPKKPKAPKAAPVAPPMDLATALDPEPTPMPAAAPAPIADADFEVLPDVVPTPAELSRGEQRLAEVGGAAMAPISNPPEPPAAPDLFDVDQFKAEQDAWEQLSPEQRNEAIPATGRRRMEAAKAMSDEELTARMAQLVPRFGESEYGDAETLHDYLAGELEDRGNHRVAMTGEVTARDPNETPVRPMDTTDDFSWLPNTPEDFAREMQTSPRDAELLWKRMRTTLGDRPNGMTFRVDARNTWLVTPEAREEGGWRVTALRDGKPIGHETYPDVDVLARRLTLTGIDASLASSRGTPAPIAEAPVEAPAKKPRAKTNDRTRDMKNPAPGILDRMGLSAKALAAESGTSPLPAATPAPASSPRGDDAPVPANRPADLADALSDAADPVVGKRAAAPVADGRGAGGVEPVLPRDGGVAGTESRAGRDDAGARAGDSAAPAAAGAVSRGDVTTLPNGRFGLLGVDGYVQTDGSPITDAQRKAIAQVGPGFVQGIRRETYDTREQAEAAAAGYRAPAVGAGPVAADAPLADAPTPSQDSSNADRALPAPDAGNDAPAPAESGRGVGADVAGRAVESQPEPVRAAVDGDADGARAGGTGARGRADDDRAAGTGEAARPGAEEPAGRDGVARAPGESGAGAGDGRPDGRVPKKPARVSPAVPSADAQLAPDAQGNVRPDKLVKGENYRISDDDQIGAGGAKGKARGNMAAIRVLKQLEEEQRIATRAEQQVLVKYIGWGGLPQMFRNPVTQRFSAGWEADAEALEQLLTPEELKSAFMSTPNAHYTSPLVIRAMFDAAVQLGVKGGRFLEPSLGVGHFLGLVPDALRAGATWHGTELDSLSARIAKQLYPQSDIRQQGFQKMLVPDDWFDAAFGNPPFGEEQLADPRYDAQRFQIHDYFFAKSLDKVRPGGVLLYVTSHGTMNKKNPKARKYIAERADLLGAVRLPSSAFEKNAMTSVTTDILVFQKREPGTAYAGQPFLGLATHTNARGEEVTINEYFAANPTQMLGIMSLQGTMRRGDGTELTLEPLPGMDMETALADALRQLPSNVYRPRAARTNAAAATTAPVSLEASVELPNTLMLRDGKLMQSRDGEWHPAEVPKPHVARVSQLVGLRDAVNTILSTQTAGASDKVIADAITAGKKLYTAFVKQHGPILSTTRTVTKRLRKDGTPVVIEKQPNLEYFRDDPLYYRVLAMEDYTAENNTGKPSALLEGPVLGVQTLPDRFDNAVDALRAMLTTRGSVDLPWIAEKSGLSEDDAIAQLTGRIYRDPQTGAWQTAAKYRSGNVRDKLAIAEEAVSQDPSYRANVAALAEVVPKDIAPTDIDAQLGAAWVPKETVAAFIAHLFEYPSTRDIRVSSLNGTGWSVDLPWQILRDERARTTWGSDDLPFNKLLESTLNQKTALVKKPDGDGGYYVDTKATELAKQRQKQLRDEWASWLWKDDARADALSRLYNDRFNVWAEAVFDGADLAFPGAVSLYKGKPFRLRPHQSNSVARQLETGNLYLAHVVGAGKTFTAAAIAIENRRLGLAKKPMIVTPNHMLGQWTTEFLAMYPTARLLVADADEFAPDQRAAFVAKASGQEWDAIIIKSSAFTKLPVSDERQAMMVEEEIDAVNAAMAEMGKADKSGNRNAIKDLAKREQKLRTKLTRLTAEDKKDQAFTFEETGVDLLIVDEAHEYKNLFLVSSIQGLSQEGSQRAYDMYVKTRVLHDVNPGRGLVFLSGTPVSNSFSELFTIQRYLQPDVLRKLGIDTFDAWVSTFARAETRLEKRATGDYKPKGRYTAFMNLPELRGMFGQVIDVKTQDDLQLPRPPLIGGQADVIVAPQSDELKAYVKTLAARAKNLKPGKPSKGEDNFLSITNDGRIAGLDIRLVNGRAADDPSSKVNQAVEQLHTIYTESTPYKGVQLVFLDLSLPGSENTAAAMNRSGAGVNIYEDIRAKLIAKGVPAAEIAFAQDFKEDEKKAKFFADVKAGRKRIVLTSTPLMGAGTNVQDRLVALHRLDVPWRPSDLEQSEGRILRQGNLLYADGTIAGVRILRYVTKGSYDEQIWGMVLGKQRMVASVLGGTSTARRVEDADEVTLSYQQAMAAATDNPLFLEKIELDMQIATLKVLAGAHADEQRGMRDRRKYAIGYQRELQQRLDAVRADLATRQDVTGKAFAVQLGKATLTERKAAEAPLAKVVEQIRKSVTRLGEEADEQIGRFAGFPLHVEIFRANERDVRTTLVLHGKEAYRASLGMDQTPAGMVASLEHLAKSIDKVQENATQSLAQVTQQLKQLEVSIGAPFAQRDVLTQAEERLTDVEAQLSAVAEAVEPADATEEEDEEDSPRVYESDETEERFAYSDPVAALIGEAYRALKRVLVDRDRDMQPFHTSSFDAVEERLRKAEQGTPVMPWQTKVRETMAELRANMTRHFPALNPTADPMHALANELLLKAERSGTFAKAKAADQLLNVVAGLTKPEVQAMSRYLALDDILADIDAGRYDGGNPLPFGYASRAEVEFDAGRLEYAVGENPRIKAAIDRRNAFTKALTTTLVEIEALPKSVLDDARYYHRQVLSYLEAKALGGQGAPTGAGSPRDVRQRKRGFQKGRVGGGDFNLAYQEAEYEWVAQAHQTILLHEILSAVKQMDQTPYLKSAAAQINLDAYYAIALPEDVTPADFALNPQLDPLMRYRQRIAMAKGRIVTALARNAFAVSPRFERMVADLLESESTGKRFAHPAWWAFLSDLAAREDAGDVSLSALSIFKAIRERKEEIESTLGSAFIDATDPEQLLALAGDSYALWQPEKGNVFYSALTVAEKAIVGGEVNGLDAEALRRVMVMGGKKTTYILPQGIAATLDELRPPKTITGLDQLVTSATRTWKAWTLLAPTRALKYNLNNAFGDFDAGMLAPRVFTQVPQAARDLWAYMKQRDLTDTTLVAEMQEAIKQGIMDQGLSAVEIPDIVDLPGFEQLAKATPNVFTGMLVGYWKHARVLTQYRENILRLAAWRHFKAELRAGKQPLGVSNRRRVQLLAGRDSEQAALLARDLVGDYGNISVTGTYVRDRAMPFYSWLEVNAKRYVNYFRNIPYEDTGALGAVGRGAAALGATVAREGAAKAFTLSAKFAAGTALASAFLTLVALFNAAFHPDEWDEARRTGREGHLILGKDAAGRILSIRVEGAFADFLGWVGLKDVAADIRDAANGRMNYGDLLTDAFLAPVKKLVSGANPFAKNLYTFMTGMNTFPDPFNPRPQRDPLAKPYGVFFDQWSMGWLYRQVLLPLGGVPATPTPPTNPLVGLLFYQVDAGEVAYNAVRSDAIEWQKRQGTTMPSIVPDERATALYYWKMATKWGEPEAAQAWLQRYFSLGGTRKSASTAIENAEPLSNMTASNRLKYRQQMTPADRERYARALAWYKENMRAPGKAGVRQTPKAAKRDTSWLEELGNAQRDAILRAPRG